MINAFVFVLLLFGGAISFIAGTFFGKIYPTLIGIAFLMLLALVDGVNKALVDGSVSISEVMVAVGLVLVCIAIVFWKSLNDVKASALRKLRALAGYGG